MATSIKTKKDEDTTSTATTPVYELGSGYSKSGKKLPSTAEEAIAAGRYLDDDGYWRTSSGYKLTTGHSQGGGYTSYDGVGGGYGGKNSASPNSITNPVSNGTSSVEEIYNYINGIGSGGSTKPTYEDYYDLTDIVDQLANMSYEDWTQGDQYRALANRYGQQGKMSMQDVLGQVSSRTGGLASSYAQTVAQQQYNDYMNQFETMAREMYQNDRSELEDQYKYMSDYNDTMYDRYRDSLSDYNDDLAAAQAAAASATKTSNKTSSKAKADDDDTAISLSQLASKLNSPTSYGLSLGPNSLYGTVSGNGAKTSNDTGSAKTSGSGSDTWLTPTQANREDARQYAADSTPSYNSKTDTITWNGKQYSTVEALQAAIDAANLTAAQKKTLQKNFANAGIPLEF